MSLIGWIIIVILAMGFAPLDDTGDYAIKSGLFSWWPEFIRSIIWIPLGLSVNYQWLILGCMVGIVCLLYTSPSPRDLSTSRMPSSA